MAKETKKTASTKKTKTKPKVKPKVKPTPSVLLVGGKPTMNYVLFTINQMKDAKEILRSKTQSFHFSSTYVCTVSQ